MSEEFVATTAKELGVHCQPSLRMTEAGAQQSLSRCLDELDSWNPFHGEEEQNNSRAHRHILTAEENLHRQSINHSEQPTLKRRSNTEYNPSSPAHVLQAVDTRLKISLEKALLFPPLGESSFLSSRRNELPPAVAFQQATSPGRPLVKDSGPVSRSPRSEKPPRDHRISRPGDHYFPAGSSSFSLGWKPFPSQAGSSHAVQPFPPLSPTETKSPRSCIARRHFLGVDKDHEVSMAADSALHGRHPRSDVPLTRMMVDDGTVTGLATDGSSGRTSGVTNMPRNRNTAVQPLDVPFGSAALYAAQPLSGNLVDGPDMAQLVDQGTMRSPIRKAETSEKSATGRCQDVTTGPQSTHGSVITHWNALELSGKGCTVIEEGDDPTQGVHPTHMDFPLSESLPPSRISLSQSYKSPRERREQRGRQEEEGNGSDSWGERYTDSGRERRRHRRRRSPSHFAFPNGAHPRLGGQGEGEGREGGARVGDVGWDIAGGDRQGGKGVEGGNRGGAVGVGKGGKVKLRKVSPAMARGMWRWKDVYQVRRWRGRGREGKR